MENNGAKLDVIGFGAINLDFIYEIDSLDHVSDGGASLRPGQEIFTERESFARIRGKVEKAGQLKATAPGGSAANTVFALARMGFKTGLIGKVGSDSDGKILLEAMNGVDLRGVTRGGTSGRCLCILDARRDRFLVLEPNANDTLTAQEVSQRHAINTHYIHLTSFVGKEPFTAQKSLIDRLGPATRISFDPGEVYARRGLGALRPLIERSFVVFVTEDEVKRLTDLDFTSGSDLLLGMGPSIVACKRGKKGAYVVSHSDRVMLPAEPVEVVDNTGAGDVFNAGFLAGLLLNRPVAECARFGIALATRSLSGFGRDQYPDRRDLRFFEEGSC